MWSLNSSSKILASIYNTELRIRVVASTLAAWWSVKVARQSIGLTWSKRFPLVNYNSDLVTELEYIYI